MTNSKIELPVEGEKAVICNLKIGILKELHRKNKLTDSLLDRLIRMQYEKRG